MGHVDTTTLDDSSRAPRVPVTCSASPPSRNRAICFVDDGSDTLNLFF